MWWKKNKWKVIVPVLIVAALAFAFWFGGNAPGLRGWPVSGESPSPTAAAAVPSETAAPTPVPATPTPVVGETPSPEPSATPEPPPEPTPEPSAEPTPAPTQSIDPATGKDKYSTDPVPEGKPLPVEPQEAEVTDEAHTCTISIECATILDNLDWLAAEKRELIPADGVIFPATEVTFYEGESVFNVLQRTCRQNRIHLEFANTPMYNSAYIEGLHNIYEFDCGERSGWMYAVNGWYPNYGSSRYAVKDGDVIEWRYTCDLGADIGDNSGGGQRP